MSTFKWCKGIRLQIGWLLNSEGKVRFSSKYVDWYSFQFKKLVILVGIEKE